MRGNIRLLARGAWTVLVLLALLMFQAPQASETLTQVFFGDTHLHTSYSVDGYLSGNYTADPDTAYRFAKGLPVIHPHNRARIQLKTPLDFLVVADHAEMLGVPLRLSQSDPEIVNTANGRRWQELIKSPENFAELIFEWFRTMQAYKPVDGISRDSVTRSVWDESVAITERHNDPGKFTAFIGWEWTFHPGTPTMHRVVLTPGGAEIASQFLPFSAYDSREPADLWAWLEKTSSQTGAEFLAIPHNPNLSEGRLFATTDFQGQAMTAAYVQKRMKWERLVEVTQTKGDSETHPFLSPDDEYADFETFAPEYKYALRQGEKKPVHPFLPGSYVRPGLLRGLEIENKLGVSPFKMGMIGSSDFHSGVSTVEENNFYGKFANAGTPELSSIPTAFWDKVTGRDSSAGGLAAVWAEENTRESLFAAFKRKEVYATTGSRIRVRFFGGWNFNERDARGSDLASIGYRKGVPMGGDLSVPRKGKKPGFLINAFKDPAGANLDRIQVIKGWLDDKGNSHEKVFNVALSDNRKPDKAGKVADVGNTVDLDSASYDNSIGAAELATVWKDKEFDPGQHAFYYVRILEIPTPRHSLFDAVALGIEHPDEYPATIQERAYTSPIWYTLGKITGARTPEHD